MYFRVRAIARFWKYAVWNIEIDIPKITSDSLVNTRPACCCSLFFPLIGIGIECPPAIRGLRAVSSREKRRDLERCRIENFASQNLLIFNPRLISPQLVFFDARLSVNGSRNNATRGDRSLIDRSRRYE